MVGARAAVMAGARGVAAVVRARGGDGLV